VGLGDDRTDPMSKIVGVGDRMCKPAGSHNIEAALRSRARRWLTWFRTRIYVMNIDDWEKIGRAHGEVFARSAQPTTMVEVRRLISPNPRGDRGGCRDRGSSG